MDLHLSYVICFVLFLLGRLGLAFSPPTSFCRAGCIGASPDPLPVPPLFPFPCPVEPDAPGTAPLGTPGCWAACLSYPLESANFFNLSSNVKGSEYSTNVSACMYNSFSNCLTICGNLYCQSGDALGRRCCNQPVTRSIMLARVDW